MQKPNFLKTKKNRKKGLIILNKVSRPCLDWIKEDGIFR